MLPAYPPPPGDCGTVAGVPPYRRDLAGPLPAAFMDQACIDVEQHCVALEDGEDGEGADEAGDLWGAVLQRALARETLATHLQTIHVLRFFVAVGVGN